MCAQSMARSLMGEQYDVICEVDPQAALDTIEDNPPDLIIMELLLPGRSGLEFLYELKSYPDWQGIPVLIFSSLAAVELSDSAEVFETMGVKAVYHKPWTSLDTLTQAANAQTAV